MQTFTADQIVRLVMADLNETFNPPLSRTRVASLLSDYAQGGNLRRAISMIKNRRNKWRALPLRLLHYRISRVLCAVCKMTQLPVPIKVSYNEDFAVRAWRPGVLYLWVSDDGSVQPSPDKTKWSGSMVTYDATLFDVRGVLKKTNVLTNRKRKP